MKVRVPSGRHKWPSFSITWSKDGRKVSSQDCFSGKSSMGQITGGSKTSLEGLEPVQLSFVCRYLLLMHCSKSPPAFASAGTAAAHAARAAWATVRTWPLRVLAPMQTDEDPHRIQTVFFSFIVVHTVLSPAQDPKTTLLPHRTQTKPSLPPSSLHTHAVC